MAPGRDQVVGGSGNWPQAGCAAAGLPGGAGGLEPCHGLLLFRPVVPGNNHQTAAAQQLGGLIPVGDLGQQIHPHHKQQAGRGEAGPGGPDTVQGATAAEILPQLQAAPPGHHPGLEAVHNHLEQLAADRQGCAMAFQGVVAGPCGHHGVAPGQAGQNGLVTNGWRIGTGAEEGHDGR
ncbi:hypothetical protein [Candidatus Synechococcus spongiarum]|uniref:hypothetical protein n=1 Tax=Candidatus Synechococcus spongiarum TaxID=431041 RepID=UPI00356B76AB